MYKSSPRKKPISDCYFRTRMPKKNKGLNITPVPGSVGKSVVIQSLARGSRQMVLPRIAIPRRSVPIEDESPASTVPGSDGTNLNTESSSYETYDEGSSLSSATVMASSSCNEVSDEDPEEEILRESHTAEESSEDEVSFPKITLTPRHQVCELDFQCDGLHTPTDRHIKIKTSVRKPQKPAKFSKGKHGEIAPNLMLPFDECTDELDRDSCEEETHSLAGFLTKGQKIVLEPTSTPLSGKKASLKIDLGLSDIGYTTASSDMQRMSTPEHGEIQEQKKEKYSIVTYRPCSLVRLVPPPCLPGKMITKTHNDVLFMKE